MSHKTVAVSFSSAPTNISASVLLSVMLSTGITFSSTMIVHSAVTPSAVALIVAVPTEFADTLPFSSTVATSVLSEDQEILRRNRGFKRYCFTNIQCLFRLIKSNTLNRNDLFFYGDCTGGCLSTILGLDRDSGRSRGPSYDLKSTPPSSR